MAPRRTGRATAEATGGPGSGDTYTNRLGETYELRRVPTARGPRYVAAKNTVGEAVATMPDGWAFAESVNRQVSVRRARPSPIRLEELEAVRNVLAGHGPTRGYQAEAERANIVIYHPIRPFAGWRAGGGAGAALEPLGALEAAIIARARETSPLRYAEIARLCLVDDVERGFVLERRHFSGDGGWFPLDGGDDPGRLLAGILRHLGEDGPRESFFELGRI